MLPIPNQAHGCLGVRVLRNVTLPPVLFWLRHPSHYISLWLADAILPVLRVQSKTIMQYILLRQVTAVSSHRYISRMNYESPPHQQEQVVWRTKLFDQLLLVNSVPG